MKTGKPHRVPLSSPALAVLREMHALRTEEVDLVFPGQKRGRPLSVMAFSMLLRRMKVEVTAHGFRSSFRDWAAERTSFPHEVAEMALAHAIGSKTEAAYRRGDLFEKRQQLMAAWAHFLTAHRAGPDEGGDNPRLQRLRRELTPSLHDPHGPDFNVELLLRDLWLAARVGAKRDRGIPYEQAIFKVTKEGTTSPHPESLVSRTKKRGFSQSTTRRAFDTFGVLRHLPSRGTQKP